MHSHDSARRTVNTLAERFRKAGVAVAGRGDDGPMVAGGETDLERWMRAIGGSGGLLSEWLSAGSGSGVATVACAALESVIRPRERIVLVEGETPVCPGALTPWQLDRMVLIRPPSERERWWAIEQALRCRRVGGVVAWVDRAPERFLRRLQLAVEQGGGRGFLILPAEARREKCWGDARFLVHPRPAEESDLDRGRRRVEIEVLAGRGGIAVAGQTTLAEICDATGAVRLVSRLADPARARRPAGA
jgi:hypothetical protein